MMNVALRDRSLSVAVKFSTGRLHPYDVRTQRESDETSRYELLIWIPNVVAFVVMLAVGGSRLASVPLTGSQPATAATLMSFGASLAATVISWSTLTPDYGVYHDHKAPAWRMFLYAYLGFLVASVSLPLLPLTALLLLSEAYRPPQIPTHMLGAAFAAAAVSVPEWGAGFEDGNNVGGLVAAVLAPTGRFGKFLLVLLSLTAPSACAPTMYTVCMSFMTVHRAFARLPRFVVALLSTAVYVLTHSASAGLSC